MTIDEELNSLEGKRIREIRRLHYVTAGEIDKSKGPLELGFDDDSIVRLEVGGDGETLVVEHTAWVDPFVEPLSDENREFVRKSGKWSIFDQSSIETWASLVGAVVTAVTPSHTDGGKPYGCLLSTTQGVISVTVAFDELEVTLRA